MLWFYHKNITGTKKQTEASDPVQW